MDLRTAGTVTPPAGARRWCAIGGIIGPVAFVSAWTIGGIVATHYSPVDDAISHLAAIGAPTRVLMTAGFVTFGIGLPIYSIALRDALPGSSWIAAAATGIATLGVAAAPLGRSSSGDVQHGILASAGYVALALTPLLAAGPLRRAGRTGMARASIGAGIVSAIALVASTLPLYNGFFQRAGLTVVDVWIVVTAVEILRSRNEPRRSVQNRAKLPSW